MDVRLLEEKRMYRRLEIAAADKPAPYLLEWQAGLTKSDTVSIDGEVVVAVNAGGGSEEFRFRIDGQQALLAVKANLLMKVKYFKLILDGVPVYTEGEAQAFTTPEEMEKLRNPPEPPRMVSNQPAMDAVDMSYRDSIFLGMTLAIVAILFTGVGVFFFTVPFPGWIFGLILTLVGLGMLYFGLVKLINRTKFHLDSTNLAVRRGPLPTTKKKELILPTPEISSFIVLEIARRQRSQESHVTTTSYTYRLQARKKSGEPFDLEESPSQPAAVYIQSELNHFLKKLRPAEETIRFDQASTTFTADQISTSFTDEATPTATEIGQGQNPTPEEFSTGVGSTQSRKVNWLTSVAFGVIGFVVFAFMLFFLGQVTTLNCQRGDAGRVACNASTKWLGLVAIGQVKEFQDIQGAEVSESCSRDQDGDLNCTYRVEIQTQNGLEPLTTMYTSGESSKQRTVQRLETYLQDPTASTLTVKESFDFLSILIWVVLIGAVTLGFRAWRKYQERRRIGA